MKINARNRPNLRNFEGFDDFASVQKIISRRVLGMGLVIIGIALILTIIGVVLSLTVSPWFWIAVVITGGYTIFAAVWMSAARAISRAIQ